MWQYVFDPWRRGIAEFKAAARGYSPRKMHTLGGWLLLVLVVGIVLIGINRASWGYGLLGLWFFGVADYLTVWCLRCRWGYGLSLIEGALAALVIVALVMISCAMVFGD